MNRLEKELRNRGIIFEADELDIMRGAEHDNDAELITVTDKFIIVGWYSAVVPARFRLYDRFTLKEIASQDMEPDYQSFFGTGKMNPWDVYVENDDWTQEDAEAADWAFQK